MLIYQYPLCSTSSLVSNNSRTERLSLLFGTCANSLGFNEEVDCLGCYCQPYIDGDSFIYQIHTDIFQTDEIDVKILDLDGNVLSVVTDMEYTALLTEFGAFINFVFNMDILALQAGQDCFKVYIKTQQGISVSVPFCRLKCDEPSVLICSDYTKRDCNNTIYSYSVIHNASSIPAVVYSNCFRLKGVLEKRSVAIENTYDELETSLSTRVVHTKSKSIDQYELRIWGIPDWQVDRLKAVLGGTTLTIKQNNRTYTLEVKSGLEKNTEIGNLWYPVIKLEKSCQKTLKSC
jgi:hypothetical protein